jgi:hypothetical protein
LDGQVEIKVTSAINETYRRNNKQEKTRTRQEIKKERKEQKDQQKD